MKSSIAYLKFFGAVAVPKTKKHTICKNMFYVYGIFSTNGMKIKEIEAHWHFYMHF
jgi:hypothetical protein